MRCHRHERHAQHRAHARHRGHAPRVDLRRRIFSWLLGSILMTALVVAGVMLVLDHFGAGGAWHRQREGARTLLATQLAQVWSDPPARDRLGREVARDLSVGLSLEDSAHRPLATYGRPEGRPWLTGEVVRDGQRVGYFQVQTDAASGHSPLPFVLAVLFAFGALWATAGKVARRLARPIDELAHVAQELGEGKLDSRVHLPCHAPGEIRVLGRALNEMAERIERQIADHRELLAGVSHELRTPLARIRLLTELGRSSPGAGTLDEIDREIVEMDGLVDQLLVSSRLDFRALSRRPLSVEALAHRALERAGLGPAALQTRGVGAELEVEGDATLLGRALANLIDNAQRHGGGLSRLSVEADGGKVVFAAEDAGPGFAPGEADRVFTAFFKGTRSENGTLGLGLSLVRRIAEAHGGTVFAQNRPEGGARVGFSLGASALA